MADLVYHDFFSEIMKGTHNCGASGNVFKLALFTSTHTPNADATSYSDLTNEVANGNGYTTGGYTFSAANNSVVNDDANNWSTFDINEDATWSNATITARYAVLYNNTAAGKNLVCQWDFGSDKASSNGTFKVVFNASGILRLS